MRLQPRTWLAIAHWVSDADHGIYTQWFCDVGILIPSSIWWYRFLANHNRDCICNEINVHRMPGGQASFADEWKKISLISVLCGEDVVFIQWKSAKKNTSLCYSPANVGGKDKLSSLLHSGLLLERILWRPWGLNQLCINTSWEIFRYSYPLTRDGPLPMLATSTMH
jgi:hypothetical protein